jgi:hypothetical protein
MKVKRVGGIVAALLVGAVAVSVGTVVVVERLAGPESTTSAGVLLGEAPAGQVVTSPPPAATTAQSATYRYWGSIAVSPHTGAVGTSYDHPSSRSANQAAIDSCGVWDCEVLIGVSAGCAAAAQAENRAWGGGYAGTLPAAKSAAIRGTPGPNPRIITWVCS